MKVGFVNLPISKQIQKIILSIILENTKSSLFSITKTFSSGEPLRLPVREKQKTERTRTIKKMIVLIITPFNFYYRIRLISKSDISIFYNKVKINNIKLLNV